MNTIMLAACRDELENIVKESDAGGWAQSLKKLVKNVAPKHPPASGGVAKTIHDAAAYGGHTIHPSSGTFHDVASYGGHTLGEHGPGQTIHGMTGASGILHDAALSGGHAGEETKKSIGRRIGEHLHKYENPYEVGGLGLLAGIGADRVQAHARAGKGATDEQIEHKQLMGETGHAAADVAGLGILAAPLIAKRAITGKWTGH